MELVAALGVEYVRLRERWISAAAKVVEWSRRGIMKKIIAVVILAVVAAGFFGLTVPRHVLNTLGFAMADCTDGSGC
jgi:hypothetical protein